MEGDEVGNQQINLNLSNGSTNEKPQPCTSGLNDYFKCTSKPKKKNKYKQIFGTIGMPDYSVPGQSLDLGHGFSSPISLTNGKRHQVNVTKPAIESSHLANWQLQKSPNKRLDILSL